MPAAADTIPPAASYADLFEPVPNAMERLSADDRLILWPDEVWPQDVGAVGVTYNNVRYKW